MVITRKAVPRRTFLCGTGAALALPVLDAMTPAMSAAALAIETATLFGLFRLNYIFRPRGAVSPGRSI